jgi:hypothetical protein
MRPIVGVSCRLPVGGEGVQRSAFFNRARARLSVRRREKRVGVSAMGRVGVLESCSSSSSSSIAFSIRPTTTTTKTGTSTIGEEAEPS